MQKRAIFIPIQRTSSLTVDEIVRLTAVFNKWGPRFGHPDCAPEILVACSSLHNGIYFLFQQWILRERSVFEMILDQTPLQQKLMTQSTGIPDDVLKHAYSHDSKDPWTDKLFTAIQPHANANVDKLEAVAHELYLDIYKGRDVEVFGFEGGHVVPRKERDLHPVAIVDSEYKYDKTKQAKLTLDGTLGELIPNAIVSSSRIANPGAEAIVLMDATYSYLGHIYSWPSKFEERTNSNKWGAVDTCKFMGIRASIRNLFTRREKNVAYQLLSAAVEYSISRGFFQFAIHQPLHTMRKLLNKLGMASSGDTWCAYHSRWRKLLTDAAIPAITTVDAYAGLRPIWFPIIQWLDQQVALMRLQEWRVRDKSEFGKSFNEFNHAPHAHKEDTLQLLRIYVRTCIYTPHAKSLDSYLLYPM